MNGCGFGGCWWIIILILIFCCGCGGCGNGCGGCGNGCVVVAATMVAAAADADLTANKRRRSITLRRFFYLSSFSKRFSRRLTIVFSAFMRAYFLSLPSSIVHGAISVEVSVIMRSTYFS